MNIKKSFFILKNNFDNASRKLITIFAEPQNCICCGKMCYSLPLCKTCYQTQLSNINFDNRCSVCGKELISEKDICLECRQEKVLTHADFVFPIHSYKLWKKDLLFLWKMKNTKHLSELFAKIVDAVIRHFFNEKNIYLVPVPPRPGKIKEKGWDQIADLCKYLQYIHGYNVINLLKRINIEEQKSLNRSQRLSHIEKSYEYNSKVKIPPDEVILIDDILTTGATTEACSKILKEKGIKKVNVITLFYAD